MGGEIGSPGNHEKTESLRDYGKFILCRGGGKVLLSSLPLSSFSFRLYSVVAEFHSSTHPLEHFLFKVFLTAHIVC